MLSRLGKFTRKNPILIVIFFIAFCLRIVAISYNPPSLNWDEVSHGYNAYSILLTGKDEWGKFLPLIFRAYGDYKLPVYIYTTAVSELFFGLSSFAVRLPNVVAGVLIVVFTYLLTNQLFRNRRISLISAFLVAVEPWSLFLSRGAFEANLGLAFFIMGVYFFVRATKKYKKLLWSIVFFGLSVWTYNSFRIFSPIIMVIMFFLYKKELLNLVNHHKRFTTLVSVITALLFIPMFWQLVIPAGQARYSKVAIIDSGAISQIENLRNASPYPTIINRVLFNRATYFWNRFTLNWISHFSGDFLFFFGGTDYQFSVPGWGLLYLIDLPFLIIGVISLIKKRSRSAVLILTWFYLSPIPSSLTRESPHVLRAITMLPTPMILTAFGLDRFLIWLKMGYRRIVAATYFIVVSLFFCIYLNNYFNSYRINYSWSWQYGYKQAVDYVKVNYSKYDKIIVTKKYGEPFEYFLFYGGIGTPAPWSWKPTAYRNDPNLIRFYKSDWYWVDSFAKFDFVNDWEVSTHNNWNIPRSLSDENKFKLESGGVVDCHSSSARCLLVTSPGNAPNGWKKLETINFLNGKPDFEIYEN